MISRRFTGMYVEVFWNVGFLSRVGRTAWLGFSCVLVSSRLWFLIIGISLRTKRSIWSRVCICLLLLLVLVVCEVGKLDLFRFDTFFFHTNATMPVKWRVCVTLQLHHLTCVYPVPPASHV